MILVKRRLTALLTAAAIGISTVGLNMYSTVNRVDAAGGPYDVSSNVTPINQKSNWCWADSTQMLLNAKLTAEGKGRILGFSQDALATIGRSTGEFETAVVNLNAAEVVRLGVSWTSANEINMSTDDEKEQALVAYIGQKDDVFSFVAEDVGNMKKSADAVLNAAGLNEDKATTIGITLTNEAEYNSALSLLIPFIKDSLANGSPVAVNPDGHWKIIVDIDETAGTFSIQETMGQPIESKSYKSVLYNSSAGSHYTALMGIAKSNTLLNEKYFITGLDIGSSGHTVTIGPDGLAAVEMFVSDHHSDSDINATPLSGAPASGISKSHLSPITYANVISDGVVSVQQDLIIVFTQPGQYQLESVDWANIGTPNDHSFNITFTVLGTATPPVPPTPGPTPTPTPTQDNSTEYVNFGNYSSSWSPGSSGSSSGTKSGSSSVSSPVAVSNVPTTTLVVPESVSPVVDVVKAFTSLLNIKENKAIELKTSVSSWVFEAKDIVKDTSKWVNFSTKVEVQPAEKTTIVPSNIASVISGKNSLVVDFAKNGYLPGLARVSVKIGDAYKNKDMYAYYLYNDGKTTKFQLVSKNIKVDNNGCVRFAMNHGCDFILVEKSVAATIESKLATMEVK